MNPGDENQDLPDPLADDEAVVAARESRSLCEALGIYQYAIAAADEAEDVQRGFLIRVEALWHATAGGYFDLLVSWFLWCLEHREQVDQPDAEYELRWAYKWVAENLPKRVTFGRDAIARLLDDLEREYVDAGWGRRGPMFLRLRAATVLGVRPVVEQRIQQWLATERDEGADCEACEMNFVVEYFASVGEDERAIETAQPLLDGRLACNEVPGITYIALLAPLARLGRQEELLETYHRARRFTEAQAIDPGQLAVLLRFQLRARAVDAATELLTGLYHLTTFEPQYTIQAEWLQAMAAYYRLCIEAGRTPAHFADLTDELEIRCGFDDEAAMDEAALRMERRVAEFGEAMDARNGNASFSELLARNAAFIEQGSPLNLDCD